MAWFLNNYRCPRCGTKWSDEWSATCDDDCPHCGCRHISPLDSEELCYAECDCEDSCQGNSPESVIN